MPIESIKADATKVLRASTALWNIAIARSILTRCVNIACHRLRLEMERADVAGLLLFDQINTRYATDATNMQVWCSHYETRCVFIALDGPVVLFDYANHPHLAEGLPGIDEYRVIPSFYYFSAGYHGEVRAQVFASQIDDLLRQHGGDNRQLAVDRLSFMACDALRQKGLKLVDGEAIAEHSRAVKSAEELTLMRASMAVCEQALPGHARGLAARHYRKRPVGPDCTKPISVWGESGSRPGCYLRAREPIPGSVSARCVL